MTLDDIKNQALILDTQQQLCVKGGTSDTNATIIEIDVDAF